MPWLAAGLASGAAAKPREGCGLGLPRPRVCERSSGGVAAGVAVARVAIGCCPCSVGRRQDVVEAPRQGATVGSAASRGRASPRHRVAGRKTKRAAGSDATREDRGRGCWRTARMQAMRCRGHGQRGGKRERKRCGGSRGVGHHRRFWGRGRIVGVPDGDCGGDGRAASTATTAGSEDEDGAAVRRSDAGFGLTLLCRGVASGPSSSVDCTGDAIRCLLFSFFRR